MTSELGSIHDQPLLAYSAGGLVVELEPSHNIVIRELRPIQGDVVVTVTDVEELLTGLRLVREYRDARSAEPEDA